MYIKGKILSLYEYLMLDEPTTMIDSNGKLQIYDIIKKLKENNQTIY